MYIYDFDTSPTLRRVISWRRTTQNKEMMRIYLVYLSSVLLISYTRGSIETTHFTGQINKRFDGQQIWSGSTVSTSHCGSICFKNEDCYSFNVRRNNGGLVCELNSDVSTMSPSGLVSDNNSAYYGKSSEAQD